MKKEIKTINITYKMLRGSDESERQFALPISAERYAELASGLTPGNKAWCEIQGALETLMHLQGYDKLGTWSAELKIETEGD